MKCECGSYMASTTTTREDAVAQADVRLCTNSKCAKVKLVVKPRGARMPDGRLRGKMTSRAHRYAKDLLEGRMVWNGRLFIWPAGKGGPGRG